MKFIYIQKTYQPMTGPGWDENDDRQHLHKPMTTHLHAIHIK